MTKNLTFLLADDDPDDAFMFEKILKEVDPSVKFLLAKDGREALDVLAGAEQLPNIVFLDLNMPKIDGKECLLFIKNDDRLRDLPVIMYTTSSLSKDIEDCMMHGAACFITKPSNIKELNKILHAIVTSLPNKLEEALTRLSNSVDTFIII